LSREGRRHGRRGSVVTQGGAAFVYVLDEAHKSEVVEKIKKALDGMEGVSKIVGSENFQRLWRRQLDGRSARARLDSVRAGRLRFWRYRAGELPFNDKAGAQRQPWPRCQFAGLACNVRWLRERAGINAGVRLGEIPNIDVAPTIAKLLGLSIPNANGKVLQEALNSSL